LRFTVIVIVLMGFATANFAAETVQTKMETPMQRNVKDHVNADGRTPDGLDNDADDTDAFRAALAVGPGIVCVDAGLYRCGDVTIPEGVTLVGAGRATVIRPNGAKRVFVQAGVNDWRLRDLAVDGESKTDVGTRKDLGCTAVYVTRCRGFEISGVTVRNFDGPGIHLSHTAASGYCRWATDASLFNIVANGNYVGVNFDERAEYMNASMLTCQGNVIGCVIHAGNVKITNSQFTNNLTGVYIEDKDNGSHGALSNCLINHNQQYALIARNVKNAMLVDNCCFFGAAILIEDSTGVSITDSIISCNVTIKGPGCNRLAGNYIWTRGRTCTFSVSDATIVQNNFTDAGPWEGNR